MKEEDFDIDSAAYREFLAHYAIAMFSAQCLEQSSKIFLTFSNVLEKLSYRSITEKIL
jgi:hypothetical protein